MRIVVKLLSACSIAAVMFFSGCESPSSGNPESTKERRVPVGVFKPEVRKFKKAILVQGTLLPERKVVVTPEVPGKILRIYKKAGDAIREGERLVLLSQTDFKLGEQTSLAQISAAQAGLLQAQTNYDNLSTQLERFKKLYEQKSIPKAEFEKVENGFKMAEAGLKAAQAQLNMAQSGRSIAASRLADTLVRAPFDGFVTERMMDEGEVVRAMPPSVVMVVMDTDPVKAEGSVNELDAFKVQVGTPVEVSVAAIPGDTFKAEVEMVNAAVDPRTRTVGIRVNVPNPDRRLKPGMTATIAINLGETEALAVPDDAVIRTDIAANRGVVFLVNNDTAIRREVSYGIRHDDLLEIKEGLIPGELVVRGGQEMLRDGQPVLVVAEKEEVTQ